MRFDILPGINSGEYVRTLGLLVIAQQDILRDFNAGLRDESDDDPNEYEDT